MKLQGAIESGDTFTFIESNSKPYVLESKLTSDDLKNLAFGWPKSHLSAASSSAGEWPSRRGQKRLERLGAVCLARWNRFLESRS